MGFPRIVSKTNKIYTKLGEFCLSADGNNFWIICHTCQEELQTQDQFWKHIQDEHNFMHGITKEHKQGQGYSTDGGGNGNDAGTGSGMMPLPLYRKMNEDEQHDDSGTATHEEKGTKDYTEMRGIEMDIKLEPHSISQSAMPQAPSTLNTTTAAAAAAVAAAAINTMGGGGHVDVTATPTLYQVPPVSAYAALVHQHVTPTLTPALSMAAAAVVSGTGVGGGGLSGGGLSGAGGISSMGGGVGGGGSISMGGVGGNGGGNVGVSVVPAPLMPQELPKDSNSTTASAGSAAVSSDDGERWYICDYESCGLKFKYQSRLELHRSVHSKERRFACELCGASFKQSCNLSTHRKKKHFLKGSKGVATTQLVQQRF